MGMRFHAPPNRPRGQHLWSGIGGTFGAMVLIAAFANGCAEPESVASTTEPSATTTARSSPSTTPTPSASPTLSVPHLADLPQATKAPIKPTPIPKPKAKPPAAAPKPVYYQNCDAVRAAGKAPLRRSDPGFRDALDRDDDGVACEPYNDDSPSKPKPKKPKKAEVPAPGGDTDPRYGTCKEAKSHGYGPYREGDDPEYDWYDDRDNDGVVCE